MAGNNDVGAFEPSEEWEGKTSFAPGVPEDPAARPELWYQVLAGQVFTLMRWTDGSTARGSVDLGTLEDVAGAPIVREGWYDALGQYVGDQLPGSL